MYTRYRISLVSLALLALSIAPPASAAQEAAIDPPQQAACTAPASGTPITVKGNAGVSTSLPFTLDQPSYAVSWTLAAPSDRLTFMTLESTTAGGSSSETLVNLSGSEQQTSGQTAVYKVKPGSYAVHVRAPAAWTVTFTPLPV